MNTEEGRLVARLNTWIDQPDRGFEGPAPRQEPVHASHSFEAGRCTVCGLAAAWRGAELECGACVRHRGTPSIVDPPGGKVRADKAPRLTLSEARELGLVPPGLTALWIALPDPPERLSEREWRAEALCWADDHRRFRRQSA